MDQFRQDMPPQGGYEPIVWRRVPLKSPLSNITKIGMLFGLWAFGFTVYKYTMNQINIEKIEMRCSRIAIQPLILAEKDRMILKQLKKNRDYEEQLMKDVPGWEVGKWKNYPVFTSVGPDVYVAPSAEELFAHCDPKIAAKYLHIHANL